MQPTSLLSGDTIGESKLDALSPPVAYPFKSSPQFVLGLICLVSLFFGVACDENGNEDGNDKEQIASCDGDHVGTWDGATLDDSITYASDCTYVYRGEDGCEEKGTYELGDGDTGRVTVEVTDSTGGDCFPEGTYTCEYEFSDTTLTYDCGDGSYEYVSQ